MSNTEMIILTTLTLAMLSLIQVLLISRSNYELRHYLWISFGSWLLGCILSFVALALTLGLPIALTSYLYIAAANTIPFLFNLRRGLDLLKYEEFITTANTLDKIDKKRERD